MMRFSVSEQEEKEFKEWDAKHKCSLRGKKTTAGGRLTFSFTPTGLGDIIEVRCACGSHKEIGNSENW